MKRFDLEITGSLFWIAVGIAFAVGAVKLRLGTFRDPGPGLIPLAVALILCIFSLANLIKGLINHTRLTSTIPWKRPALVVGAVLLYMWVIGLIGFLASTFLLMIGLFALLVKGQRGRWPKAFLCAAVAAASAWLIFSVFLRVPFP